MAKEIVNPEIVEIDGTNLASYVSSVTIGQPYDDHDVTGMGGKSHEHMPGLRDDSITLNFWQDFDAGSVDATIGPIHAEAGNVDIVIKRKDSAADATNPEYTLNGRPYDYSPLSGSAGEPSATEVTFQSADGDGVVRNPAF